MHQSRHISSACLCLTLVAFTTQASEPPPLGVTSRGKVVRVVDGDTLDVEVTYKVRVRLDSCWAPEKNTEKGKKAHEDLDVLALGKPCVMHIPTAEARSLADVLTLGRVVGSVWIDRYGESLNEWQVRKHNAATAKNKPLGE
jgi:endonuclease YncB( thermonuclease family)